MDGLIKLRDMITIIQLHRMMEILALHAFSPTIGYWIIARISLGFCRNVQVRVMMIRIDIHLASIWINSLPLDTTMIFASVQSPGPVSDTAAVHVLKPKESMCDLLMF